MPASPNDQTPRPTTGIRFSSPFLDALQAQKANPSKTSEKRTATPKLIPSPEGNTVTAPCRMTCSRAHPRSRGEHAKKMQKAKSQPGSSPLARGTQDGLRQTAGSHGLIPARAGNTVREFSRSQGTGAHPRSRGEHLSQSSIQPSKPGSSPLARGTPEPPQSYASRAGLIPARAGNTMRIASRARSWRAHPRSRGEHKRNALISWPLWGSSPLARGTQQHLMQRELVTGLIPARAGNTGYSVG